MCVCVKNNVFKNVFKNIYKIMNIYDCLLIKY